MIRRLWFAAVVILLMAVSSAGVETKPYGSFKVTVTFPYRLSSAWTAIPLGWNRAGTASAAACTWTKFSLKSIAGGTSIDDTTIDHVKRFFSSHGVVAAGGLAMAGPGGFGQFRSLDYTDPKGSGSGAAHVRADGTALRRDHSRRLFLHQHQERLRYRGQGQTHLAGIPTGVDGRGVPRPDSEAGEGRQSLRARHHQPQLVSLVPGIGLRSRARTADIPRDLDGR